MGKDHRRGQLNIEDGLPIITEIARMARRVDQNRKRHAVLFAIGYYGGGCNGFRSSCFGCLGTARAKEYRENALGY